MKGIILSGGSGTRLFPITKATNKQLLPIYDKPMIYYPLSILMLAGIKEILVITSDIDQEFYQKLLLDGSQWGIHITYAIQEQPRGLAEALIIGENFINNEPVCLILGDNVFYGDGMIKLLVNASNITEGAMVFAYYVNDPENYGVVEFDKDSNVVGLQEKPEEPKSSYAVTGLYFFDKQASMFAKSVVPSERGELEIISVLDEYLKRKTLKVELLGRGIAWLDTGTYDGLLEASNFVSTIQKRQGLIISCPEEIAYRKKYITLEQLKEIAENMRKNSYGKYLLKITESVKEYYNR